MRQRLIPIALLAALATTADVQAESLRDFTLITTGDVQSSQEVRGGAFIGGDLTGNGINVGISGSVPADRPSLAIVGDIDANYVHVDGGYAIVNDTTANTNRIGVNSHQPTVSDSGIGQLLTAYAGELTAESAYFKGLAANSVPPTLGSQPAPLVFDANPDPSGVAVFTIAGSLLNSSKVQSIRVNRHGATSIVFNVSGTSVTLGSNFVGDLSGLQKSNSIWNFYEATTVNLGRTIYGATLAPTANVFVGASTEGAVFAASANLANGEVHAPNYGGILRPAGGVVPEPSTLALAALAIPVVVALARRRRAA